MAELTRSESEIFRAAVELPVEQRPAFLAEACGEDYRLRNEVESLLKAHVLEDSFLQAPALAVTVNHALSERPGSIVGRYKLREQIGEGGFGVVYVAEQEQPVRRKVALKVIKPGMDSKDVIARFEAERQALALMDHPNVARVLDAGTTESGRPYFVMELVQGVTITEFCDRNSLPTRDRLLLFADVCRAVQHAHQKGIIHRDLKPSNIMVTLHDGIPVAKVIDFGVSKALSQQLTEKSIYTAYGQMIGTPQYMSPEQAEMSGLGIDTRSDIFSLGVLLYELLTGQTPLDVKRLRESAYAEILRIIREEEPPRPSLKISTLGEQAAVIARQRHTDPEQLRRDLSGELDWIVMKCLEKDRSRRYETAIGLARDVERYLQDEPVEACPPSSLYRLKKFARKHRGMIATASAFVALLLVGGVVSGWLAVRERQASEVARAERATAIKSLAEEHRQRDLANQRAAEAQAAREELRETLYAAEMNLVDSAFKNKRYLRAVQLLEQQRPAAGQRDLRGFEWHFWRRHLHGGRLETVQLPPQAALDPQRFFVQGLFSLSQDASRLAAILRPDGESTNRLFTVFDSITGREIFAPRSALQDNSNRLDSDWIRLVISGDGSRVAIRTGNSSSETGYLPRISVYDALSGKEIRHFEELGIGDQFVLSTDGDRLAAACIDLDDNPESVYLERQASVKIWNTSTGELIQTLPLAPWRFQSSTILWSPDGSRLLRSAATAEAESQRESFQQYFQILDVNTGEEIWRRDFSGLSRHLTPWDWSPDGTMLAVAEQNPPAKPRVQLWDSQTGASVAVLDRETATQISAETLTISPDNQYLAAVEGFNNISVWKLPKFAAAAGAQPLHIAEPIRTLGSVQKICAIGFTDNSQELKVVDGGGSITSWDIAVPVSHSLGPDLFRRARVAAFSPDASKVAFFTSSTSEGKMVQTCHLWDLVQNRELLKLDSISSPRPDFSHDGRRVAITQRADLASDDRMVIFDTETGGRVAEIPIPPIIPSSRTFVIDQDIRADGERVAALLSDPTSDTRPRLNAWDVASAKLLYSVEFKTGDPRGLNFSRDGASIIVGAASPSTIVCYDAATGSHQESRPLPTSSIPLFVDPENQLVGASHRSDFVLCDLVTGGELLRLPGYEDVGPMSFVISPDGSRFALGRSSVVGEGEITLWSRKSGRQLMSIQRSRGVDAMCFSPDGHRLFATFGRGLAPRGDDGQLKPIEVFDATPLEDEQSN
jgi:serine/threonine protein kinase/WD40 repeat protein